MQISMQWHMNQNEVSYLFALNGKINENEENK